MDGKSDRGLIFNIQRFSIHDGPGIRTTVFMKGCPLKCPWCSNPESQDSAPNLMVRDINCRACGACAGACPRQAIRIRDGVREIDWERCDQCLQCVSSCLYGALTVCGRYMDVEEVLDEIRRDEAFYRNSGGGITVSGGEPLFQAGFVTRLLSASKNEGFQTALDTTGHAAWERIEAALPFVDLFLWDLKHMDPEVHKRFTGVGNELILENLRRVSGRARIWLRMPLIAGFNDSNAHMEAVLLLGKRVGAEKVSLLPYHEGGRSKSDQMGRPYAWSAASKPPDERIEALKHLVEREGLGVSVGN